MNKLNSINEKNYNDCLDSIRWSALTSGRYSYNFNASNKSFNINDLKRDLHNNINSDKSFYTLGCDELNTMLRNKLKEDNDHSNFKRGSVLSIIDDLNVNDYKIKDNNITERLASKRDSLREEITQELELQ